MEQSSLELHLHTVPTRAYMIGLPLFISSTTEILTWLATACRASTAFENIQACRMELKKVSESKADLSFTAELKIIEHVSESHASCWQKMFRNPVIAHNYPTPSRNHKERGLELSLDLILTLARTNWAAIYDGRLLLKGFNTLLTPIVKFEESIVWHFTVNQDGDRLSYNDGIGSSCIDSIGEAIFDGARHFVGWTDTAKFLVGKSTSSPDAA